MTPNPLISRRRVFRLAVGGSGAALTALGPTGASAGRHWCRVDPVIRLGAENVGPEIHIWAAVRWTSQRDARRRSRGPIKVIVSVPTELAGTVKRLDRGRGFGDGFRVTIKPVLRRPSDRDAIPIRVQVLVPFDREAATMTWVTAMPRGGDESVVLERAMGRANRWMGFATSVPRIELDVATEPAPALP